MDRFVVTGGARLAGEVAVSGAKNSVLKLMAAALLAAGGELQAAVGEALSFLDQSLDAGFRPGMGAIVPDRFFWALPPPEEGDEIDGGMPDPEPDDPGGKSAPRRVH
mgnify:CR=1 FL=1